MAIQDYFNQSLTWQSKASINKFGDYSWGAATTIQGRLQLKKTIVRNETEQSIIADAILYTKSSYNIRNHDKMIYTDSTSVSRTFEVVEVYEARNRANLHHKKVLLKYANV